MKDRPARVAGPEPAAGPRADLARSSSSLDSTPGGLFGRTARAGVFAIVSALLALGAHRLAGGTAPPSLSVFAVMSAFVLIGWYASRRQRSGFQLAALVGGSQLAAHGWFVAPAMLAVFRARSGSASDSALVAALFCHHGASAVSPAELAAATRGLDLSSLRASAAGATATAAQQAGTAGLAGQLALMLAAHLGAASVVAWWLRIGERKAWSAVGRFVRSCTLRYSLPRPSFAGRVVVARAVALTSRRWSGVLSGRGPPVFGLALSR